MNADAILSAFICDPLRFKQSLCWFYSNRRGGAGG